MRTPVGDWSGVSKVDTSPYRRFLSKNPLTSFSIKRRLLILCDPSGELDSEFSSNTSLKLPCTMSAVRLLALLPQHRTGPVFALQEQRRQSTERACGLRPFGHHTSSRFV